MQLNEKRDLGLKKFILKIETLWWMTRPGFSNPLILISIAGCLSANKSPNPNHLIVLISLTGLLGSAIVLLNDLLDQDDDVITAPYLPLPAGLLSPREAKIGLVFTLASAILCLLYINNEVWFILTNISFITLAVISAGAYCIFKHTGFLASIMMSIPYVIFALISWLLGGGTIDMIPSNSNIIIVIISSFFIGFSGNILAGLRDVDKDPLVGNQTLPVRLGPQKAFKLVGIIECVDFVLQVWLATQVQNGYLSLPLLAISLILMAISFHPILLTYIDSHRDRIQRISDIWLWSLGKDLKLVSLVCIFSLPIGLAIGFILRALRLLFQKGYKRQILEGGLLVSLSSN